jgi:hypothetical protein
MRTKRISGVTSAAPDPGSRIPDPATDPGSRIPDPDPVTVAIDILDEDHSLRLAMRRLGTDPKLRAALGASGQRYWQSEHSMPRMVEDYEGAIAQAAALPDPRIKLPAHLFNDGQHVLDQVLTQFSLSSVWQTTRIRDGEVQR